MQSATPSLLTRDDTFFGVCQGLGEDFGFNPGYLRAAMALLLFWNPLGAAAAYAGAGVIVAVSRWVAPNPMVAPDAATDAQDQPSEPKAETEPSVVEEQRMAVAA